MKVWVSIREDVEVDVSPLEVLSFVSQFPGEAGGLEVPQAVVGMLSRCLSCLVSVPDGMLEKLQPDTRAQLVKHLREQANRYDIKVVTGAV